MLRDAAFVSSVVASMPTVLSRTRLTSATYAAANPGENRLVRFETQQAPRPPDPRLVGGQRWRRQRVKRSVQLFGESIEAGPPEDLLQMLVEWTTTALRQIRRGHPHQIVGTHRRGSCTLPFQPV